MLIQNAGEVRERQSERVKGWKAIDRTQILAAETQVKVLAEFVGRYLKVLFVELARFLDKRA